jgi:hypothetical protein
VAGEHRGAGEKPRLFGEGSAIAAAAEMAAVSLRKRPDAEALALWLADAPLAHCLKWPASVPLIAGQIRLSDLWAAARPDRDVADKLGARVCPRRGRGRRSLRRARAARTPTLERRAKTAGAVTPRAGSRSC